MSKYARVIVNISHEAVDRPFEYIIPSEYEDKIVEGQSVKIPFGKGDTLRDGYVVAISDVNEYPVERLKYIAGVNEKATCIDDRIMAIAGWMKRRYGSTMIAAMQTVLPVKKKVKENVYKTVNLIVDEATLNFEIEKCIRSARNNSRYILLKELKEASSLPLSMITDKLGVSRQVVSTLEKNGIVNVVSSREYRNPAVNNFYKTHSVSLSDEQQRVVANVSARMDSETPGVSLLHGITGSGKTEVYIELINHAISKGKQAIVLIPEIALTFQTLMRFYARFGNRVSVIHSKMSDGERFDQYEQAKSGKLDIIIGPRSALFVPFPNLGIIIIDEEHEASYKSEKMPKYHARDVAEYIAKRDNALLLLGSATPSVDTYYKAASGEYNLEVLKNRNGGAVMPTVHVVDMRNELKEKNRSPFSRKLKELITERMLRGEQAMLFINRRGMAGFVSCRECGYVQKCPHCDVSLSEHGDGRLVCHYCDYSMPKPAACPECGSKLFAGMRAGTEKIEEEIKKIYPSATVLRMDGDTTKNKDDYEKILSTFAAGEADILVGTQMIVKGHDFSNVTLVGVIAADLSLNASDYRAAERTFQLVTQAAGRAGRGQKKGDVIIQTYQPDNYAIIHSSNQNYEDFYNEEILYRDLAGYPPVAHMMAVQFFSAREDYAHGAAKYVADKMNAQYNTDKLNLIGPSAAVFSKIRDVYRTVFYLKADDIDSLVAAKDFIELICENIDHNKVSVQYDIDPVSTF